MSDVEWDGIPNCRSSISKKGRYSLQSIPEVSNAIVEVSWIKRKKRFSIVSIKMMI